MNSRTKRRFRKTNKDLRIAKRMQVRKNGRAYEMTVLANRKGHDVEVWRSDGHGLWERLGRVPVGGDPTRDNVMQAADKLIDRE